jgi:hypothetical protein
MTALELSVVVLLVVIPNCARSRVLTTCNRRKYWVLFAFPTINCDDAALALLAQAATVTAVAGFNVGSFPTFTLELAPSKLNARPSLPVTQTGPLCSVPVLPLPDRSAVVVPVPSSIGQ